MTRIKICGLQRLADAQVAAAAGVDYIGLVFVPGHRRCLDTAAAAALAAGLRANTGHCPQIVGLFVDQPLAAVRQIIQAIPLDAVQLCGQESPDYCRQLRQGESVAVIKVLHIPDQAGDDDAAAAELLAGLETAMRQYQEAGCLITLDRLVAGLPGGTGQSFDWKIAAHLSGQGHQFLLAGGLTPDNVAAAINQVQPWGVDVSSGVETAGIKDPAKIQAFVDNARCPGAGVGGASIKTG